ncbi:hypothetical protein ACF3OH_03280 [Chryseomicrobium aureum]|uniref:hypothetical protein n=1 Tax=Chryseomicrobium aureum TaxID=1441723 RepID=UPI0019599CC4|nr:hypothetical protein [Chryseomicrobium aureum]MBM7707042.1 hypothetical protein [Chryseomicrobium aureum]
MKKVKLPSVDEYVHHLFVHGNEGQNFALFSGLTFPTVLHYFADTNVIVLLEHGYEDASFDMHTQFEYIVQEEFKDFVTSLKDQKSRLCLLDVADEKRLIQLSPQEQAELLYVAHKKETFRSPFYHTLKNRFVYLGDESDRISKVYFREYDEMMRLVVHLFNQLAAQKTRSNMFFRRRVQQVVPELIHEQFILFEDLLEDGALLSLARLDDGSFRLELREIADPSFPDEIMQDVDTYLTQPTLGLLPFVARSKMED